MELTLIFPHQLFADHPCLKSGRPVALIEDPLFFGTDPRWPMQVHRQRALLHRASMAAYADTLRARGYKVVHQRHHQAKDTQGHLQVLVEQGFRSFHLADPIDDLPANGMAKAVLAGGCFWCVEAVYLNLEGVNAVVSGYAGGHAARANYEAVCTGTTGHAEVIEVEYDSTVISFGELLKVFFSVAHDPTQKDRQGNDR